MRWMESIGEAISYSEENITQELTIESIAKKALISPFYFNLFRVAPKLQGLRNRCGLLH